MGWLSFRGLGWLPWLQPKSRCDDQTDKTCCCAGEKKPIGFLVGAVMRETRGKADPAAVNRLIARGVESDV